jgi:hypothetical protein
MSVILGEWWWEELGGGRSPGDALGACGFVLDRAGVPHVVASEAFGSADSTQFHYFRGAHLTWLNPPEAIVSTPCDRGGHTCRQECRERRILGPDRGYRVRAVACRPIGIDTLRLGIRGR